MIQEKLVDFTTLPNSQPGTKFIGFDLDGKLKSKDSNGTIVEIGSGNTGSGGTFTYKKHASMSPTGNVGLLAMSDVYALVPNPQGVDDYEVTAKIANTEPGIPGNKAVIGLLIPITPYIEPKNQVDKISFNRKPQDTDQFNISGVGSGYNIAFSNTNDNANEINVSNKIYKDVIDSLILKLQVGNNYAEAGNVIQTEYGFTNQINTAGSRFTGTGINDLRVVDSGVFNQESVIDVEVIANGFDIFEFSSVGGEITNGSTIVGDTSGATATALYTTDMGGGLFWTRVKVTSGTFSPGETVTIDGNFGATYNNFTFQTTNDLLKVSNQVFNQPLNIYYIVMSGNSAQNINGVQFYFDGTDTGHTVGDKWFIETKYGAVILNLQNNNSFTVGETIQGQTSGATAIVVEQNSSNLVVQQIYGGFSTGESIVGLSSSVNNVIIDYDSNRFFGEVFFRIKWNYNNQYQGIYYIPTTFVATLDTFEIQNEVQVTTQSDYILAQELKDYSNQGSFFFSISFWYGGGAFLYYQNIFLNNSNPYGTFGELGIKYFSSPTEFKNAIMWAFQNESNVSNWFSILDMVDVDLTQTKIRLETLQKPYSNDNNYMNLNIQTTGSVNSFYSKLGTEIITQGTVDSLESIKNTILGVIVSETVTDLIIKDSLVQEVKLSSQADGEVGCLPFSIELNNQANFLIAWRNGKVISFYGLYLYLQNQNIQLNDNYLNTILAYRGVFNALDKGIPDGTVLAAREFVFFDN